MKIIKAEIREPGYAVLTAADEHLGTTCTMFAAVDQYGTWTFSRPAETVEGTGPRADVLVPVAERIAAGRWPAKGLRTSPRDWEPA